MANDTHQKKKLRFTARDDSEVRNEGNSNPETNEHERTLVGARRDPRPVRLDISTSSYASHTQSSKAKKTEKVDLGQPRTPRTPRKYFLTADPNEDLSPCMPSPFFGPENRSRNPSFRGREYARPSVASLRSDEAKDKDENELLAGGEAEVQASSTVRSASPSKGKTAEEREAEIAELEKAIKEDENDYELKYNHRVDAPEHHPDDGIKHVARDSEADTPQDPIHDSIETSFIGSRIDSTVEAQLYGTTRQYINTESRDTNQVEDLTARLAEKSELISKQQLQLERLKKALLKQQELYSAELAEKSDLMSKKQLQIEQMEEKISEQDQKLVHQEMQQVRINKLEEEVLLQGEMALKALEEQEVVIDREEKASEELKSAKGSEEYLRKETKALRDDLWLAVDNLDINQHKFRAIRKGVEQLNKAVKHASQTSIDIAPDIETLKNLEWNSETSTEVKDLHRSLFRLVERFENRSRAAEAQYTLILATKDEELTKAKKHLHMSVAKERENTAFAKERNEWKRLFENETREKQQVEWKFEGFKKKALSMYQPDLERRNKELQIELNASRDENAHLQERIQTLKTRAQQWESEYKTIKSRAEKDSAGLEFTIQQQKDEMLLYIKQYRHKTNDPAHWELRPLQERIAALEHAQQVTHQAFDRVKLEKGRMEEKDIPKLLERITGLEEETLILRDSWARGGILQSYVRAPGPKRLKQVDTQNEAEPATSDKPTDEPTDAIANKSNGDGNTHAPNGNLHARMPRCLHPEETAKREAALNLLREEQKKAFQEQERVLKDSPEIIVKF